MCNIISNNIQEIFDKNLKLSNIFLYIVTYIIVCYFKNMNVYILYISSILQFISIYLTFIYIKNINTYIYLYYIGGTITSVYNHGYNCILYQRIDRLYMRIGVLFDLIYIPYYYGYNNHIIYTLLACSLYLYSKIYKVVYVHVFAHILITISHILVLNNI